MPLPAVIPLGSSGTLCLAPNPYLTIAAQSSEFLTRGVARYPRIGIPVVSFRPWARLVRGARRDLGWFNPLHQLIRSSQCVLMADGINFGLTRAVDRPQAARALRFGLVLGLGVIAASFLAAVLLPQGFALAAFGDTLQVGLVAAIAVLTFQNFLRSQSRVRIFWFLIFAGSVLWTLSNVIWSLYELWFARPVPDAPVVDILLFVKMVPLTAAVAAAPSRSQDSTSQTFGLLDVFILMLYSLYLYAFGVFAYRLSPGGLDTYNFHFSLADAIGNQIFMIVVGFALLRSQEPWRGLYRLYFLAASCYVMGSNLCNVAIDTGRYYTGSLYDLPLVAALAAFVCMAIAGRTMQADQALVADSLHSDPPRRAGMFDPSQLAMLVALSTPLIGIWLLSNSSASPELRPFRLGITLFTMFLLTMLLSIKQDLLTVGLMGSLRRLSETYRRIDRFKTHLTQSEKLAALGELVAQVAIQIKGCMALILQSSTRMTSRPDMESRIQSMAGKIGQYALRTDVLVDHMLHFAQETPLRLVPLDIKPVLESALHLSRVAKLPNVRVDLVQLGECPPVRGDSGQLLHVFLQLISNAVDVLEEKGGGTFDITIQPSGSQLILQFADSGPGLKEPQRVFEPFYTTKPVGKGTGLGLSTCYGIIQQHEGEISCRNRPQGGAVFTILLPCVSESVPENGKASNSLLEEGVR
jgi:signal transduction histidine kinase